MVNALLNTSVNAKRDGAALIVPKKYAQMIAQGAGSASTALANARMDGLGQIARKPNVGTTAADMVSAISRMFSTWVET